MRGPFTTLEKVTESNRIEGIEGATGAELEEFDRFMTLQVVGLDELCRFVSVYQPNAALRIQSGMNVRVGHHIPPPGGPTVGYALEGLLADLPRKSAWRVHRDYENLHPFTDGNGRSGRMLWYWMMRNDPRSGLGFLHAFYYQTLDEARS